MSAAPSVNTKKAEHRTMKFADIDAIEAQLDRVQQAHDAGTLETTGNWGAGQIFEHVANGWRMGLDGVDFKAPLILRMIFIPLKNWLVTKPPPRGIKLRGGSKALEPASEVTFEAGMADLRATLGRVRDGEQMTHPSALFGAMTHEKWLSLNLGHSAMHMGFIRYPGA